MKKYTVEVTDTCDDHLLQVLRDVEAESPDSACKLIADANGYVWLRDGKNDDQNVTDRFYFSKQGYDAWVDHLKMPMTVEEVVEHLRENEPDDCLGQYRLRAYEPCRTN